MLTLGERRSIAFHRGNRFESAAAPVDEVVDTTGCGDCYHGVFFREYLESHEIQRSMDRASAAAAHVTAYLGGFQV